MPAPPRFPDVLEILSYFPSIPFFEILSARVRHNPLVPAVYRQRFDVLRTFSQTCKNWRAIFIPLAFERIEACIADDSETAGSFYRQVGQRLEGESRGLIKCIHLWPHVQYM